MHRVLKYSGFRCLFRYWSNFSHCLLSVIVLIFPCALSTRYDLVRQRQTRGTIVHADNSTESSFRIQGCTTVVANKIRPLPWIHLQSTSLITTLGGASNKCPYSRSVVIPEVSLYVLQLDGTLLWAWAFCRYSRIVVISKVDCTVAWCLSHACTYE